MKWMVAEARVRFSELLRAAAGEPQIIYNRDRPVAVVVDPQMFDAFEAWRRTKPPKSIAEAFERLRVILNGEASDVEMPPRVDRINTFIETAEDVSM